MAKIKQVIAREILNSKGNPTIETTVVLQNGITSVASCPAGVSTGSYEAVELRDHDQMRFSGLGVLHAVNAVENTIAPKIIGMEVTKQREIDKIMLELDATQNKARLGANAILSVSIAVAKAAATSSVLPLFLYLRQFLSNQNTPLHIPTPLFNCIEGGKHAPGTVDFQEFLLIPTSSLPYPNALQLGVTCYTTLKELIHSNGYPTLVGDEGGFSPQVSNNYNALSLLQQAIGETNYKLGFDVFLGIDAAANTFYSSQGYQIKDKQMTFSAKNLTSYYLQLAKEFHILYLEDVLAEDDWNGWKDAVDILSQQTLVVGDDLTATNPYRLQIALDKKAITGIIIKPNQIGSVIEALAVAEVARAAGLKVIVSHRGGETNDNFIADFAVAVGADYIKCGGLSRGERITKYNRLSQIYQLLQKLK